MHKRLSSEHTNLFRQTLPPYLNDCQAKTSQIHALDKRLCSRLFTTCSNLGRLRRHPAESVRRTRLTWSALSIGVTRERDVHYFPHSTSSLPEFACYALPFSGDSVSMPNPLFCSSKARSRLLASSRFRPFYCFTFGLRCGSLSVCNDGCQEDCAATSLYAVRQTKKRFSLSLNR